MGNTRKLNEKIFVAAVLIPVLALFTAFFFYPCLKSLYYIFTDYNYLNTPSFVGLKNITHLFHDAKALKALVNTFIVTFCSVPVIVVVSLLLAVFVNKLIFGKSFIRSCIFVTQLTSTIVAAIIFKCWFNEQLGIVNSVLGSLGMAGCPWLTDTTWAMVGIILLMVWLRTGYYFVLFLAGLANVDTQLYEAAKIDGANSFRLFWNITLPQLRPVTVFITMMALISGLKCYAEVQVLTAGGPYGTTKTALMYMFEVGFTSRNVGYGCTIAMALFLITLVLTLIQMRTQRFFDEN